MPRQIGSFGFSSRAYSAAAAAFCGLLLAAPAPASAEAVTRIVSGTRTAKAETPATAAASPATAAPAAAAPAAPAAAAAPDNATVTDRTSIAVFIDRAKIIRLPDRSQTVVIGNPAIADLALQRNGIAVVTGKSYGVTNVIAMDSGGNILAEATVAVSAPTDSIVTVQRGEVRQSYACTPSCLPSVQLGDANVFFSDAKSQAEAKSQMATKR